MKPVRLPKALCAKLLLNEVSGTLQIDRPLFLFFRPASLLSSPASATPIRNFLIDTV